MNVSEVAMALAAGISVHAALTHGLVGLSRRPRDRVRLAFAAEALAVAAGSLAVIGLYSAATPEVHAAVMKLVFFPAGVVWAVSTLWMVAFYTGVRPLRWLLALSIGFCAALVVNLALPWGLLHRELGAIHTAVHAQGVHISVLTHPAPHPLNYVNEALILASFAFMFYASWRVYRRGEHRRALAIGLVVVLFSLATVIDSLTDHGVVSSLYLTQLSFVAVIFAVSVMLRRESLQVEAELRMYRTHLESLIDDRVKDLDKANEQLALEVQERLSTEETLRRRVAELNALQHISQMLSNRGDLVTALDHVAPEIASLLAARYARIDLTRDDAVPSSEGDADGGSVAGLTHGGRPVDADVAIREIGQVSPATFEGPRWAGLPADLRERVTSEGVRHLLVIPMVAGGEAVGILSLARDGGLSFSDEEGRLAQTVADDLAAAIENERLHRRQTRQVAEEERQRLARDLHDAVTQTIYSATLIAEALPAVWEREPSEGLRNLVRLQRLVRAALAEMRTLLFELRPSALAAAPLDSLLARLADALAGQIQVPVDVQAPEGMALPDDVKLAFYRVTQEAFSNIAKYAHATSVDVDVRVGENGAVAMTIRDDGRGFEREAVSQSRMGLLIMRERLVQIGASFAIDSRPGTGTTIRVRWSGAGLEAAIAGEEGREPIAEHPRDDRR